VSTRDSDRSTGPTRREVTVMGLSLAAGAVAGPASSPAQAQEAGTPPPLIPRASIFGNPDRSYVQLSHDGRHLSWLAPVDGVLNVHVAPIDNLAAARPVTSATRRPVYGHFWAYDNRTVVYADDVGGDENIRIFAVDIATLAKRDLTPLAGVKAQVLGYSRRHRTRIAIGLNDRDPQWHDLWDIDIATGERRLVRENRDQIAGYVLDQDLIPRLVTRSQPDGSEMLYRVKGEKLDTLEPVLTVPFADSFTTAARHFTADGKAWYLASSVGRNRTALFKVDFETGAQTLVAEHPKVDIGELLSDARTLEVTAVSAMHVRQEWIAIDRTVGADLAWLKEELKADFGILGATEDDTRWVIAGDSPERPAAYYLLDRPQRRLTRLFSARPQLERYTLAPMYGHIVRSRDGLDLVSYLTLPANQPGPRPARPLPMVLSVHGGPWARDTYGYEPEHQWLANRGYAVLSVNFRGSTGFGKAFVNAGDMEWGGRMHDDLIDALNWAVAEGIADRDRVAILGASYGGYAALVGATFTPGVFRCAVSVVGVSNLETFIASIPPYWQSFYENLVRRIGDPRTEAGLAHLRARSPVNRASAISRPLLILQGANDPRVKQAESDQIVAAAKGRGLPVTYVVYPDEGHGFIIPANRVSSYAIIEAFLAQHLGAGGEGGGATTRFEPIGADLRGSSLAVDGAQHVPGLEAALKARG
jgi:dipeptidyl aminopeptidase/acylaminoacyl peptidase